MCDPWVPILGLLHLNHVTSQRRCFILAQNRGHSCPISQGWMKIRARMRVHAQHGSWHTVGLRKGLKQMSQEAGLLGQRGSPGCKR